MHPFLRLSLAALALPLLLPAQATQSARPADPRCAPDNGGMTLPSGFCAIIFADSLAGPRHLTVAPNGDVVVALRGANRDGNRLPGGLVVLRDTDGDGRADAREQVGAFSATGVTVFDGHVYTENGTAILRYALSSGALAPSAQPDTVARDLPGGGHSAKSFVIARDGALYVNFGSRTNVCQERDRTPRSKGVDPCTELETRAGIWRFDARKLGQTPAAGEHFARGIRNAVAITINPRDNALYVMQHGRDDLASFAEFYTAQQNAESPAEELFRVERGDDFGWPYCYFDTDRKQKLMTPEFGGDGRSVGRCASKKGNVAWFPGHWAPNALLFYTGSSFPAKYREGAFIAFHGSWNRYPLPQAGFNVVFQPMRSGRAAGNYEVFADGFAANLGTQRSQGNRRPSGLAQGPDGALYITDDAMGRVWKVVYSR
jgi:glucose/arabinose dehydrogenase